MIALLDKIFGDAARRRIRLLIAASAGNAVLEGIAVALCVPVLLELLRRDIGAAGWWLIPLTVVVAAYWVVNAVMEHLGTHVAATLRRELFARLADKIIALPLGWFDSTSAGSVTALVTGGSQAPLGVVLALKTIAETVIPPVIVLVVLLFLDWPITLAVLIVVPLLWVLQRAVAKPIARADADEAAAVADANARLIEFSQTQPVLRASGREDRGLGELSGALRNRHATTNKQILRATAGLNVGELSVQLGYVIVLAVTVVIGSGAWQLGPHELARLITAAVFGIWALRPIGKISTALLLIGGSAAALGRIDALLSHPELAEPDSSAKATSTGNAIELRDVRFGYREGIDVLSQVNITVPAGSTTALVGPSGSGKTTIVNLVARFWDANSGSVRVDGVDVRDLRGEDLMDRIALVPQDVYLFDDTLEANIRVGKPDATEAEVRRAASLAQVDSIVERLPQGWQNPVGAGGNILSGGERQRVSIARALLKDAPIVLLDEASSALDARNEAAIAAALGELGRGRTLLIIAHQLSTIADADHVVYLRGGKVIESGSHTELFAADGEYARFWREQQRARSWRLRDRASEPAGGRPA
ncbi:ABC transporter ATP-binding protein [Nocardia miyunensis]|uniref:ABC transporter ATP-binding protein n=1 Tax=Nocardia miyunensis TaxID=282684 RepID=UPI00082FECFA|nr:ABC transporter ATP-binding protein [Nocardia miyunensis]